MTTPDRPYLTERSVELLTVDDGWCALSVPLDLAPLVLGALEDLSGPAFSNVGTNYGTWFMSPGSGADWPDLSGAGVEWKRAGDQILVPGQNSRGALSWLRFPLNDVPIFTDPTPLRMALEMLLGPLEQAGALGPVVLCHFCSAPSRDVKLIAWGHDESGPGWNHYSCVPCWDAGTHQNVLESEE